MLVFKILKEFKGIYNNYKHGGRSMALDTFCCMYCSAEIDRWDLVSPEEDVCSECYFSIFPDDRPEEVLNFHRRIPEGFRLLKPDLSDLEEEDIAVDPTPELE